MASEDEKLAAFVEPAPVVADRQLRPFTVASLILLRKTANGLLTGDQSNLEFDVAAFLYAHEVDVKAVRQAAKSVDDWQEAVLEYSAGMTIPDFVKAASEIKQILEANTLRPDYEVEDEGRAEGN